MTQIICWVIFLWCICRYFSLHPNCNTENMNTFFVVMPILLHYYYFLLIHVYLLEWCLTIIFIHLFLRVCRAKQAASCDQEHSQTGPGDRGTASWQGPTGGGQGHPTRPGAEWPDPERPGYCECSHIHNVFLVHTHMWQLVSIQPPFLCMWSCMNYFSSCLDTVTH